MDEQSKKARSLTSAAKRLRPNQQTQAGRRGFLKNLVVLPALATAPLALEAKQNPAAPQPNFNLGEVAGYKLEQTIKDSRLAILPLGAYEYHGPSGFCSADSALAVGLAERLAPRFKAAVFPVVHFTHCPAHTAVLRGSVSIRSEVMVMYFGDILRSVVEMGFKKIFVLNGHSGNIASARTAISDVTREKTDSQMLMVNWWETLTAALLKELNLFKSGNGGRGHGGPLELSVAAVFAPQSVEAGKGPDLPATPRETEDFPYYLEKADVTGWPGYSGNLSEISKEKGEKLAQIALDRMGAVVESWLKNGGRPGNW